MKAEITNLYHVDNFVPDSIWKKASLGFDVSLTPTDHAKDKAKDNKYMRFEDRKNPRARIQLPSHVYVNSKDIFEIGVTKDGTIRKIGFRQPHVETTNCEEDYNKKYELVLIIDPKAGDIITLYLNEKGDTHESLNTASYSTELPEGLK